MSPAIPAALAAALAQETASHDRSNLAKASESLSMSYRSRSGIRRALSPVERAAYLAARFPSTYAAAQVVWRRVLARANCLGIRTMLDAGAGPGTASWALFAESHAPDVTLLERDAGWQPSAENLARALDARCQFVNGQLEDTGRLPPHDAVVASYALNELDMAQQAATVQRLWRLAGSLLVLIEPGTPAGFATIRAARQLVLSAGGAVVAPCTHQLDCPVRGDDWCHFDVQVERSALHRSLKAGTLSHEVEKFSYIAFQRSPVPSDGSGRIVRRPIRAKGHMHFDICREGQIQRVTISKRQGEAYRTARDTDWGDLLQS